MADLEDFRYEPGDEGPPPPGPREPFPVALAAGVLAMLVAVVGLGYYLAVRRPAAPKPAPSAAPHAVPTAMPSPSPTPALALPSLEGSDAIVRELAKGLSPHPQLALWLTARGLVRTFVVVVENVAAGESPRPHLGFLAPKDAFQVVQKRGRAVIAPRSYARYDAFADGVASLDAAGCARVYRQLDPLIQAAARELGYSGADFAKAMTRAIAHLEQTPVVEDDVALRPVRRATVVYELADPRLEGLSRAQKHLLRMGPANVRKVQAKLRELAVALGLRPAPGA